jgi:phosphoserine phosphatase
MKEYLLASFTSATLHSCQTTENKEVIVQEKVNEKITIEKSNFLASWNPKVRDSVLNTIESVPYSNREIVFDMDGTLISESPSYYIIDLLRTHAYLQSGDMTSLISGLNMFMADPEYHKKIDVFVIHNPPKLYKPMIELVDYLKSKNFKLILSTGSPQYLAEALCKQYFPQFDVIIGTQMVGGTLLVNDQQEKVTNLKNHNLHPAIAFGNSTGDFEMMNYTPVNRFLILKDAPEVKEEDKVDFYRKICSEKGITTISVKKDWLVVFD